MTAFIKVPVPPFGQRTAAGYPWVTWHPPHGWVAAGSRGPAELGGTSFFWRTVVAAVSTFLGGGIDQAHTTAEGVLAAGALGATLGSRALQDLLHQCLLIEPARTVEVLLPLYHSAGVYTRCSREGAASLVQVQGEKRHALESFPELARVVTLTLPGEEPSRWTSAGKERARLWVSTASHLFRDERMDAAQLRHAERWLPGLVPEEWLAAVRWAPDSAQASWQYTKEQQFVWGAAFLASVVGRSEAFPSLFGLVYTAEPFDGVRVANLVNKSLLGLPDALGFEPERGARWEEAVRLLRKAFGQEVYFR